MSFAASKSTELINNTIDKADDIIEKAEEKQRIMIVVKRLTHGLIMRYQLIIKQLSYLVLMKN